MSQSKARSCELVRDVQNLVVACSSPIHRDQPPTAGCAECVVAMFQNGRAVTPQAEIDPFANPTTVEIKPRKTQ